MTWCGDVTYVPTDQGWLYQASVIDLASRRLLGYAMGERHDAALAVRALEAAVATRGQRRMDGTVFHTDRGSELRLKGSLQHRLLLVGVTVARRGLRREFSSPGSCGVGR